MASQQSVARQWIEEARIALIDARARSHPSNAWEALQERDQEGNPRGSLPYSARALDEFAAAHRQNPEDIRVLHHLAIAHHAWAWDLELVGDPRAAREWEEALGYWRAVASSREFWAAMEAKLHSCEPAADPEPLREAQRSLLEHLLDVHVEFIRHYCETGVPQRANSHLGIIQRAKIPPTIKKRLEARVFGAMTASVADAKASSAYESALVSVERFLELFPEHLPALRMFAEVSKAWVSGLSWQHDWHAIQELSERASPPLARAAKLPALTADPLARSAIEDLAFEFIMRGADRAWPYFRAAQSGGPATIQRDDAADAFELVVYWGRLASPRASGGSQLRGAFAEGLLGHAQLLRESASEAYGNRIDPRRGLAAAIDLYGRIIAELEEASRLDSVDPQLFGYIKSALDGARAELTELESERAIRDLSWGDR